MKTLKDIQYLKGVKVLLLVDFNVPVKNEAVVDDYRIRKTLPTIDHLISKGAIVIMVGHLQSAEGDNLSLEIVSRHMNQKLNREVVFIKNFNRAGEMIQNATEGQCYLLENIRYFDGEKKNDPQLSKALASLADIYVNDAFSVSHRPHASVVGVPKFLPSCAGFQLQNEVENLSKAFNPSHPFLFILGGAKFETKMPLLQKFINIADSIFVGGALAHDIMKARGYAIGMSKTSDVQIDASITNSEKIVIPADIINQDRITKNSNNLDKSDKILDAGAQTMRSLGESIKSARFILWNGPLGLYEDGYKGATLELAKLIADSDAVSIIGGGDTLAAVAELGLENKFTFVSTAGGAMLDFLAKGTLPGIEALSN
jgi:phosphoglycerate kinase